MDKTQLKRHDIVYVSRQGKDKIWQAVAAKYTGEAKELAQDVLQGKIDIPGFVRRSDVQGDEVPLGFVHHKRMDGNRLRLGAFTAAEDIMAVFTPYEVLQRKAFAYEARNHCMETVLRIYELAEIFDVQIGVLGSVALEMLTGLPYTDDNSDIDLLVKPARYNRLLQFYRSAQTYSDNINMDFELDLPNGYGVKLAEIFMETQTVLGKSLVDVDLLQRKDVMEFLEFNCACGCTNC